METSLRLVVGQLQYWAVEDTIEKAEKVAEKKISKIEGPLFHRKDIGTSSLISKRVKHMDSLR